MKIVVLGAGAVGLTVAAKLSRVADVHAVARKKHADAVQKRGFLMTGISGEGVYRFSCSEDLPDHGIEAPCNTCIAELIRVREKL